MADLIYEQNTFFHIETTGILTGDTLSHVFELPATGLYGVRDEDPIYITRAQMWDNSDSAMRPANSEGMWVILLDVGGEIAATGYPATQPPKEHPSWRKLQPLCTLDMRKGFSHIGQQENFDPPIAYRRDRGDKLLCDFLGRGGQYVQPVWWLGYLRTDIEGISE